MSVNLTQLAVFGFFTGFGGALGTIIANRIFIYFEKRALEAHKQIKKKLSCKNGE